MYILGIIPARAGSKGIVNKNIYRLCEKALISYTIEAAVNSNLNYTVITSDIPTIKAYLPSGRKPISVIKRPAEFATDTAKAVDYAIHALKKFEATHRNKHPDAVMILQPTSPLRTVEDINKAIDMFARHNIPNPEDIPNSADSLYSGYYIGIKTKEPYDKHKQKPHFQRNGAIFITARGLLEQGKLWSDNAIEFEIPTYRSVDIDSLEDMKHAELLIKGGVLEC